MSPPMTEHNIQMRQKLRVPHRTLGPLQSRGGVSARLNATKSCNGRRGATIVPEAETEVAVVNESGTKRTMRRVPAMMMIRERRRYADDNGVRVPRERIQTVTRPRKVRNTIAVKVIGSGEAMSLPVRWIQRAYRIGRRRVDARRHLAGKGKSADRIAKVCHRNTVIPNIPQRRMARTAQQFQTILWRRIWPKMILPVPHNLKSKLKQVEYDRFI